MKNKLIIGQTASGAEFSLPVDFATQSAAILAKKRVGKTYTGSVIAEELAEANVPFVVLDPTGAWWGLRSSLDGNQAGYGVFIIGGQHGDVPLEPTAGAVIADLVVDKPGFYIIDLSATQSNAEQDRFATDFAERLYRAKERNRFPLQLIVDEADAFAPQRPFPGQQRMLGAFETIVRRGGIRGLGSTMITQRPAVLNKSVLTQTEVLIVLQTNGPQDQDAIDDWVSRNGTKEQRDRMMGSLASLGVGEAWIWSPSWLQVFEKIRVRTRRTYNSSGTPKVGEHQLTPAAMAPVDIEALGDQIRATVERAKENDPAALKAEIRRLKDELQAAKKAGPPLDQILSPVDRQCITSAITIMETLCGSKTDGKTVLPVVSKPTLPFELPKPIIQTRVTPAPPAKSSVQNLANVQRSLAKAERSILTALAQHGACGKAKLAALTGYTVTGGAFNNALSSLRNMGTGAITRADPIQITDFGTGILGEWEPLPTGRSLIQQWLGRLSKAERAIFDCVTAYYPRVFTKEEIAAITGYEATGGSFNNALSALRTLELITRGSQIKASDNLF
jgi:hypothetical protein